MESSVERLSQTQLRLRNLLADAMPSFCAGNYEHAFNMYTWATAYAVLTRNRTELQAAVTQARCTLFAQGRPWDAWRLYGQTYYVCMPYHLEQLWLGERNLAGKFIAVLAYEHSGLGDDIFVARYIPLLRDLGAERVAVVCREPLRRLFLSLRGITSVQAIEEFDAHHAYDYIVPLMTLPGHLHDLLPAHGPYLSAHPADLDLWQCRLPAQPFKIGLVWRSSNADPRRDFPNLEALRPLWSIPGVQAYSLVRGDLREESEIVAPVIDLGSEIDSMADTAAIMANMDLIVTVDTGPAHLAGALGRPVWVALKADYPCWYWWKSLNYYPHARTFVADTGDEEKRGPVRQMAELLSDLLGNKGRRHFLNSAGWQK